MFPALHTALHPPSSPGQWMLTQVGAKCGGVSSQLQLTDNLLHLLTPNVNPSSGLPSPPLYPHLVPATYSGSFHTHPPFSQNTYIPLQPGDSKRNSSSKRNKKILGSSIEGKCHNRASVEPVDEETEDDSEFSCEEGDLREDKSPDNCNFSHISGCSLLNNNLRRVQVVSEENRSQWAYLAAQPFELQAAAADWVLCSDKNCSSSAWLEDRPYLLGEVQASMLSPPCGQPTVSNTRANTNTSTNNNQGNSKTKNNKNNIHNSQKNKGQIGRRQVEPDGGGKEAGSEVRRGHRGIFEEGVGAPGQEETKLVQQHTSSSNAVDAKEVEKLLQEALWKSSQHQKKKRQEVPESGGNSGGCDTGYSSRCSTPPSLSSPPGDHSPPKGSDSKQSTKRHIVSGHSSTSVAASTTTNTSTSTTQTTRDSRSQSPTSSTSSSSESYCNSRQKRHTNCGGSSNNYYNNYKPNQGHYPHHHNQHHQQYHQPSHHVKYHNNHFHHNNHSNGGNYYGYRDNRLGENWQYFNQHLPDGAGRRGGYNNYHNNHKYDRYNGGYNYHEPYHNQHQNNYRHYQNHHHNYLIPGNHPRFNPEWVPDFHSRNHHINKSHNNITDRNRGKQNQPRVLSDRAGTFCEEEMQGQQQNDCRNNSWWRCEVEETPSGLLNGTDWDQLSQEVWATFKRHQQTNKTFDKKIKLKEKIFKIVRNVLPRCRLYVVGSSLSGFGADCSDVDMCLVLTPHDMDQRTEAITVLKFLQRQLNNCGFIREIELIRAKVPILKFRDTFSLVDVDLNCNNTVGVRNTHLLNSYSQLDWRVRPLALVVKLWAQHHNINNAKDMTISSYSLVLMVIHYLQHGVEPPVLPCLQKVFPDKFRSHNHIGSIPITEKMPTFTSNNKDSLGKLFHGFLNYFANKFTFIEETISVRTGGTVPTEQCRNVLNSKNNAHMWKYLCIEEPFDLTNTARSVYDEAVFEHVKKVFADSFKLLDEKKTLKAVLGDM